MISDREYADHVIDQLPELFTKEMIKELIVYARQNARIDLMEQIGKMYPEKS